MNERINSTFEKCKAESRVALVAYITGCDPDFARSLDVASAVIRGGADILEIGIPFSDPLADGEANQLAAERAISSGADTNTVLSLISNLSSSFPSLPIVIFTYLNPIAYSALFTFQEFAAKASQAGADALLCLDLTPEEDKNNKPIPYSSILKQNNISIVSLVTPRTSPDRIPSLAKFATGFIYYVSREGVTGESKDFNANFADRISLIKKHSKLPVVVGFGISNKEHVHAAASAGVDGVVVGSAIVRKVEAFSKGHGSIENIENFVRELKSGVYLG